MRLRHTLAILLVSLPALVLADASVPKADIARSRDPEVLGRYEGSFIVEYVSKAYDEISLPLSVLEEVEPERKDAHNNKVFAAKQTLALEGKLTRLAYVLPAGRSPLEVLRNYQEALTAKGGQVLFECKGDACGGEAELGAEHGGGWTGILDQLFPAERITSESFSNGSCALNSKHADQRYFAGRVSAPAGDNTVAVLTYTLHDDTNCKELNERTIAVVAVLEAKPREQKMVTVKASEMASAIGQTGKVALYGILFDFDKADVKPESKPQLEEIAALLKADPPLKLLVVGHTDNKGGAAYNLDLSNRRAAAVVKELVASYGISAERLSAQGMGSGAPVASNDSEEGRAKNRRVELVKQ